MSRRYARDEDTGERFLRMIECDAQGCTGTIKPNPEIALSGWMKCGGSINGERWEADYCPTHAHLSERQ